MPRPYYSSSKGFTLIIALLVTSIILSVGLAIANISYKQQILSSTQNDSLKAFYAADAGIECALYWDLHFNDPNRAAPTPLMTGNPFPISLTPDSSAPAGSPDPAVHNNFVSTDAGRVTCNGVALGAQFFGTPSDGIISFPRSAVSPAPPGFLIIGSKQTDPCVQVTVKKTWVDAPSDPATGFKAGTVDPGEIKVTITSDGYSTCDPAAPRRVERTLIQTYSSQ